MARMTPYLFLLDPPLLASVQEAARAEGVSVSKWLRQAAAEKLEAGNGDSSSDSGGDLSTVRLPGAESVPGGWPGEQS